MEKNWAQIDDENERYFEKQMEIAKKGSAADHDFFHAAQLAKTSAKENDLHPYRNENGELKYNVQQGLKAACYAREDIAAVLMIQQAVLRRLDRNRSLLWVTILLLAYIAYCVS
jgi:hypothetical protein